MTIPRYSIEHYGLRTESRVKLVRFLRLAFIVGFALMICAGCAAKPIGSATPDATRLPANDTTPSVLAEEKTLPVATTTLESTAEPLVTMVEPTLAPGEWKTLPVIPTAGTESAVIYSQGLARGNNSRAFSKVGDCESTPAWFLGPFDKGPNDYRLGEYSALAEVISEFKGSFSRNSIAAQRGFNASSVFSPLWADPKQCKPDEGPLECEFRVQNPIFAFIMLGSNDYGNPSGFESKMRRVIEFSIQHGVVPILATKADNLEGDESINATIAQLAREYRVPLWNFWAAVQPIPSHGLQTDKVHLTFAPPFFDDLHNLQMAWPVRNLTALQTLDALWRGLKD